MLDVWWVLNGNIEAMWWIHSVLRAERRTEDQLPTPLSRLPQLIPGAMVQRARQAWDTVCATLSTVYSDGRNKQSEACLRSRQACSLSRHIPIWMSQPRTHKGFYHWDWLLLKLSELLPSVAVKQWHIFSLSNPVILCSLKKKSAFVYVCVVCVSLRVCSQTPGVTYVLV